MSRLASSAESPRGSAALWFAVLGAPAAWFVSLVVSYYAVHEVCRVHSPLVPRIVSLLALVVAVAAGMTARAVWVQASGATQERTRFLAQIGVMAGVVFSLIVVLHLVATLLLPGCHDRPRTQESPDVLGPPPRGVWRELA
ncbi:MAG TPA: hypothetical protein VL549_07335 [Gemmatimonadales bacterium]|nr:hypothetical protein [Gemmatimonadales bacterium]